MDRRSPLDEVRGDRQLGGILATAGDDDVGLLELEPIALIDGNDSHREIPPLEAAALIRTVDTEQFIACDSVVVGTSRTSRNELFDRLAGSVGELYIVGDAIKPRWAYDAIGEGASVGINL